MLSNQQLFKQIPKQISQWTQQDVQKWFKVNDISIDSNVKMSGTQLIKLTPSKMINQFKFSSFLARKISEWIQFQIEDFQQYIQDHNKQKTVSISNSQSKIKIPKQQQKQQNNLLLEYKSQEHFKNIPSQLLKHKSEENCSPLKEPLDQDDITQIYKPFKYKPKKNSDKKIVFFDNSNKHNQGIKQKKFFNNKPEVKKGLVLKDLMENQQISRQQVETYKYLPQASEYFGDISPFNRIIKQNQSPSQSSRYAQNCSFQKNVKFISSQLMLANSSNLIAQFDKNVYQISKTTTVGRSTSNDIVLKSQGVSRNHAEIIVEQEINQQGKTNKAYYLRDIGSKFGTYVQVDPQKPKRVAEMQYYCIGQTILRIDQLKLSKSRQKFDIVLSIIQNQQQKRTYLNKSVVTIGNKKRESTSKQPKSSQITKRSNIGKQKEKRDLELEDNYIKNYHCRFIVINGQIYLQQVQGNMLQKLQKNTRFQLTRSFYQVKFGDGNVILRLQNLYRSIAQNNYSSSNQ